MLRIWLCIIALLCASTGGFGSLSAGATDEVCAQRCPDDDSRGQCASDCADCLCCSHPRPVMLAAPAALLLGLPGAILIEPEEQKPPSVDAGDILHVPITAPA